MPFGSPRIWYTGAGKFAEISSIRRVLPHESLDKKMHRAPAERRHGMHHERHRFRRGPGSLPPHPHLRGAVYRCGQLVCRLCGRRLCPGASGRYQRHHFFSRQQCNCGRSGKAGRLPAQHLRNRRRRIHTRRSLVARVRRLLPGKQFDRLRFRRLQQRRFPGAVCRAPGRCPAR